MIISCRDFKQKSSSKLLSLDRNVNCCRGQQGLTVWFLGTILFGYTTDPPKLTQTKLHYLYGKHLETVRGWNISTMTHSFWKPHCWQKWKCAKRLYVYLLWCPSVFDFMGPLGIKGEAGEKGQIGEPGLPAISAGPPGIRGRPGATGPPGPKASCKWWSEWVTEWVSGQKEEWIDGQMNVL